MRPSRMPGSVPSRMADDRLQSAPHSTASLKRSHSAFPVAAVAGDAAVSLAALYFLAPAYSFPRSVLVGYLAGNGILLAAWRAALDRLFPLPRRRALVVGTGPAADRIAETVRRHPWSGVEIVG